MSEENDSQWNKNFKIPKRKSDEFFNHKTSNLDYNSGNSMASNSYYEYYNQYSQSQWQQTTAYPQHYYGNQGASAITANSVDPVTQNICNALSNIKERPKNYQKNIFKNTVPDVDDPTLPKELRSQFQPLFCKLCSAQLSSNVMAKLHYKSRNHEKKIRKFLQEYSEKTGTPLHPRAKAVIAPKTEGDSDPKWFHCEDCDLPLTGKLHAESHYMGKNHQKVIMGHKKPTGKGYFNEQGQWIRETSGKRASLPDGEDTFGQDFKKQKISDDNFVGPVPSASSGPVELSPPSQPKSSKFHCSICNVGTTCHEQLAIHFLGQKHKKKLKQLGVIDVSSEPVAAPKGVIEQDVNLSVHRTPSGDYYCPTCNLTLASGIQFKGHIKGKQHLKKTSHKSS